MFIVLTIFSVVLRTWPVEAGLDENGATSLRGADYAFYQNRDAASPLNIISGVNGPLQLGSKGQQFRLRTGLSNTSTTSVGQVVAGSYHSCVLGQDAQLYCWGGNSVGQLGNNSTAIRSVPTRPTMSGVLSGKTIIKAALSGDSHTCVIASDNLPYCWGKNINGQLGNNSTAQSTVPAAVDISGVLAGKTVSTVSLGYNNTCAVASDNNAYCWGVASSGQLGNNSITQSTVPVAVSTTGVLSGKTIQKLSTGANHSCVIASDNLAYCWGSGTNGRLGNNSTANSLVPVAVNTAGVLSGKTILQIATGSRHSCAIASDNLVYCWGRNTEGQLGDNTTSQRTTPVAVNTAGALSGKTILSISAGGDHTCVIASDNLVYCWGRNVEGEIGDGTMTQRNVPTAVNTSGALSGKTIAQVSVGEHSVCARDNSDIVYCWGGRGSFWRYPLTIRGNLYTEVTGVLPVAITQIHPAIPANLNTYRLQYAPKTAGSCSVQASGFADVTASTPISYHTNPSVTHGQTASSSAELPYNYVAPSMQQYISSGASPFTNATDIGVSETALWDFSLVDNNAPENTSYCLRIAYSDGTPLEQYASYPEVTTGELSLKGASYRIYQNQNSTTPGAPLAANNTPAQLSVVNDTFRVRTGMTFEPPSALMTWKSLSVGEYARCGITTSDEVYCWGRGDSGQRGNGTLQEKMLPELMPYSGLLAGKTVKSLSLGTYHACAIASDDNAYCWGYNFDGELGDGTTFLRTTPVAVNTSGVLASKTIKQIVSGAWHTCVIASDDQAYCWGNNYSGELGNNSTTGSSVPVAVNTSGVLAGKTIKQLAAGSGHTCAIASDDQTYCWGDNWGGKLGNNSIIDSSVPVAVNTSGVLAGKTVKKIATNSQNYSNCVIASDDQVYCWGYGGSGQLGNNSTANSLVPTAVDTSGVLAGKIISDISAGPEDNCALDSDSHLYCWGASYSSGTGRAVDYINTPSFATTPHRELAPNVESFRLQYAQKTAATCSVQATGFSNVTSSTPIAFNANPGVSHGTAISTSPNDPVSEFKNTAESYISSDSDFTNPTTFDHAHTALFDFSLRDNNAPRDTTYCLRVTYADGAQLDQGNTAVAEITTATAVHSTPTIETTVWDGNNLIATGQYDPINTQALRVSLTPGGRWYTLGIDPELVSAGSTWTLSLANLDPDVTYTLQAEAVALDGVVLSATFAVSSKLSSTGASVYGGLSMALLATACGVILLKLPRIRKVL